MIGSSLFPRRLTNEIYGDFHFCLASVQFHHSFVLGSTSFQLLFGFGSVSAYILGSPFNRHRLKSRSSIYSQIFVLEQINFFPKRHLFPKKNSQVLSISGRLPILIKEIPKRLYHFRRKILEFHLFPLLLTYFSAGAPLIYPEFFSLSRGVFSRALFSPLHTLD